MSKQRGFSLIELMVVVGIIAILLVIALPSYNYYILKSRRADAKSTLGALSQLQEIYYSNNNRYATDLSLLNCVPKGVCQTGLFSPEGYYKLSLGSGSTARAYELEATATSVQVDDKDCAKFVLTSRNEKKAYNSSAADTSSKCW